MLAEIIETRPNFLPSGAVFPSAAIAFIITLFRRYLVDTFHMPLEIIISAEVFVAIGGMAFVRPRMTLLVFSDLDLVAHESLTR